MAVHAAHMTYRMVQSQLEAEIFESWMTHTGLAQNSLGSGRIFFFFFFLPTEHKPVVDDSLESSHLQSWMETEFSEEFRLK